MVQLLPMVETPALRAQRMAAWGKELLDPKTSGVAALKLEGLGAHRQRDLASGPARTPTNRSDSSRPSRWPTSTIPSEQRHSPKRRSSMPKFRAYALAALASMDQNAAHMKLRNLMSEPDNELRYGAFNALRTADPHDASLGRVRVLDEPPTEEQPDEAPDSMALALTSAAKRPRLEDPFALYVVDSEGPPVVHVSRTAPVRDRRLRPQSEAAAAHRSGHGGRPLNASEKDDEIEISKIVPSKFR